MRPRFSLGLGNTNFGEKKQQICSCTKYCIQSIESMEATTLESNALPFHFVRKGFTLYERVV